MIMWKDLLLTPDESAVRGISLKPYKSSEGDTSDLLWNMSVLKILKIVVVDLQTELSNAGTDVNLVDRVFGKALSMVSSGYDKALFTEPQKNMCVRSISIDSVSKGSDGRTKISVTMKDGFGKTHETDGIEVYI